MGPRLFFLSLFSISYFAVFLNSQVFALDETELKKNANEVYSSVLSPYCPGRLLSHCPSSSADLLKQKIHDELAKGKSKQEVMNDLYKEFGDEIKAAPSFSGFGAVGWIAPILFIGIGLFFLLRFINKQKKTN